MNSEKRLPADIDCSDLLNRLTSGIVITSGDGTILYVNRAFSALTGYSAEECEGKTPRILKSGRHTQEEYALLWKTVLAGQEFHGRFINKKKSGELYWEYIHIHPLRSGGAAYYLAIIEDITALKPDETDFAGSNMQDRTVLERLVLTEKRMLAQLEKLLAAERSINTMRADLINVLSHEFRTPLSVIQSSADILKSYRTQMDDPAIDKRLEKIAAMVGSITALLDEALGIWHKDDAATQKLSAPEVVREVVDTRFTDYGREIRIQADDKSKSIHLEGAHHLRGLIASILARALAVSPPASPITVRIHASETLEIEIHDESIADERTGSIDSMAELSTGLDQAITRRALKKLHGSFSLERGTGTISRLSLPLTAQTQD